MSYMTPYYFSASAGQTINVWMRSNDFLAKVGLAISGSTNGLAEGTTNAWQWSDAYPAAVIQYTALSDNYYVVEATSVEVGQEGSFTMSISEGKTGSFDATLNPNLIYGPNSLVYAKASNLIFMPATRQTVGVFPYYAYDTQLLVVDPVTYTVVTNSYYALQDGAGGYIEFGRVPVDVVYNTVDTNVYVLSVSGSSYLNGGSAFMDVWNASGSVLLSSNPVSLEWGFGLQNGVLTFNQDQNQILITLSNAFASSQLSWSLYDCNTNAIVHNGLPPYKLQYSTYVSSSNKYYVAPRNFGDAVLTIDPISYTQASSTITSSCYTVTYIPELDVIVGAGGAYVNNFDPPAMIYSPSTENVIATLPGVYDMESPCFYNPCINCIIIPDDAAGDTGSYSGGGFSYVDGTTFEPRNFTGLTGAWGGVYVDSKSEMWMIDYNDNIAIAVVGSIPTASFPQPPYPSPPVPLPPTASFSGTPLSGFAPLVVTFTNASSNATIYNWGFGDSTFSSTTNPVHTYNNPGIYDVALMASGSLGTSYLTQSAYVTVTSVPLPAFCTSPPFQSFALTGSISQPVTSSITI